MKLSIIIVNYNSKKQLKNCLDSLEKWASDCFDEIIVVDNASSKEKISANDFDQYKKVKFYSLDSNLGFGAANNFGVKQAGGDLILLLNPDTLIIDDSIKSMARYYLNDEKIGAMTCLLYGADGKTLQKSFFGKFQSLLGLTIRRYNFQEVDTIKEFMPTDIVTGACLLIKKSLFERIGGFDQNFFMYLEDDDLCKRLVDSGYQNGVFTKSKIIHLEGQSLNSNKFRKRLYYKSQDYYWYKHNGLIATILMKIIRWPYKAIKQASK